MLYKRYSKTTFQNFRNVTMISMQSSTASTEYIRIKEAVEKFLKCRDYSKGIARIKYANPHCGHDYFRPFVALLKGTCKSWYLCPRCDPQDVGSAGEDRMSKSLLIRKDFCFSRNTSHKMCS
jgi:hypothetical protein